MTVIVTDYQLAVGHNNVAGYTPVSSITDGTDILDEPLGMPAPKRGVRRYTLAQPKFSGTGTSALIFARMTAGLLKYMTDTYEGLVTVRIPFDGTTFADYNATLIVPDKGDLEGNYYIDAQLDAVGFQDVRLDLFDIEAV